MDSKKHQNPVGFSYSDFLTKISLPSDKITLGYLRKRYEQAPSSFLALSGHVSNYSPDSDEIADLVARLPDTLIPSAVNDLFYLESFNVAYESMYRDRSAISGLLFCQSQNDHQEIRSERQKLMNFYVDVGLENRNNAHMLLWKIQHEIEEKIVKKYHPNAEPLSVVRKDPRFIKVESLSAPPAKSSPITQEGALAISKNILGFEDLIRNINLPSDQITLGHLRECYNSSLEFTSRAVFQKTLPQDLITSNLSKKLFLERYIAYQMYLEAYVQGAGREARDKNWRTHLPELKEFYIKERLVDGDLTARYQLDKIWGDVEKVIRKRHGVEPHQGNLEVFAR